MLGHFWPICPKMDFCPTIGLCHFFHSWTSNLLYRRCRGFKKWWAYIREGSAIKSQTYSVSNGILATKLTILHLLSSFGSNICPFADLRAPTTHICLKKYTFLVFFQGAYWWGRIYRVLQYIYIYIYIYIFIYVYYINQYFGSNEHNLRCNFTHRIYYSINNFTLLYLYYPIPYVQGIFWDSDGFFFIYHLQFDVKLNSELPLSKDIVCHRCEKDNKKREKKEIIVEDK